MTEQEEFLKDTTPNETNAFEEKEETTGEAESSESNDDGEKPRNRRERRLYERYRQRGEETNKLAEEVVKLRSAVEAQLSTGEESDFLKIVEPIFGSDTAEKLAATDLLKRAIRGAYERAVTDAEERVYSKISEREEAQQREYAEADEELEDMMDAVEKEYGANLSDPAEGNGFLSALERLSRKDEDGSIREYADPFGAYEYYKSHAQKGSRAKDLASRSNIASGNSSQGTAEKESMEKYLRDIGII